MPGPAISKGSDHFFNVLYEGNGGGQRVGKFIPFTDNGTIFRGADDIYELCNHCLCYYWWRLYMRWVDDEVLYRLD